MTTDYSAAVQLDPTAAGTGAPGPDKVPSFANLSPPSPAPSPVFTNGVHHEQPAAEPVAALPPPPAIVQQDQSIAPPLAPSATTSSSFAPPLSPPVPQPQPSLATMTPEQPTFAPPPPPQQPVPIVEAPSAVASAPEVLPPPPVVPLPSSLPHPVLNHSDSTSSVIAQPPTPAPLQPVTAAPSTVATPVEPAPPAAIEQQQPLQAPEASVPPPPAAPAPTPSFAPAPTTSAPVPSYPSSVEASPAPVVVPPPIASASSSSSPWVNDDVGGSSPVPVTTTTAATVPEVQSFDYGAAPITGPEVKMEKEPVPSPPSLLKRSAPEQEASGVNGVESVAVVPGGSADDERDVKRQRVESEPAYVPQSVATASPAPTPVQGYDPSVFLHSASVPPQVYSAPSPATAAPTAAPVASTSSSSFPTISPNDLHTPQPSGSSPYPPSVPTPVPASAIPQQHQPSPVPQIVAPDQQQPPAPYQPPAQYQQQQQQQPPAPSPAAVASPYAQSPAPVVYAPSPAPEISSSATASGPLAVMTKDQQKFGLSLLRTLKKNRSAPPFLKPVDPIALHIPDYFRVVTRPMDLGTVELKLNATGKALSASQKAGRTFGIDYTQGTGAWEGASDKVYRTAEEFKEDVERVWENCFKYNGPKEKNPVSAMAAAMQEVCEKMWRTMPSAPLVEYQPEPPRLPSPEAPKKERRPSNSFVPTIRRSEDGTRPKREIHAPARDLAYVAEQQQHEAAYGTTAGPVPTGNKSRTGRVSGKTAQEQLRFCKEVIKELFKKVHEPYAYPFYEPVNPALFPDYHNFIKKPMDLGTIRSKLDQSLYPVPPYVAFENDVRQVFKNCYIFNPAGTPVNDWGRRLEAVFDAKWYERPQGEDEDEVSDDDGISAMEQQLAALAANIEHMKANKKAQKEAKRAAERAAAAQAAAHQAALAAAQASHHQPQRPPKPSKRLSGGGGGYGGYGEAAYGAPAPAPKRAGAPKKSRASGGGGAGGKKKKANKRQGGGDSSDEFEESIGGGWGGGGAATQQQQEMVSFEMKRELAVKIVSFEGENLERAIDIIRQGRPDLLSDVNKEIELDIDQLDQQTLLNLYRFVCPGSAPALPRPRAPKGSNKKSNGGGGGGGNKRKNLDEMKESERIEMLEARLRDFEQGGGGAAVAAQQQQQQVDSRRGSGVGTPGVGMGGDVASSDSSDSEDESGSESDDED